MSKVSPYTLEKLKELREFVAKAKPAQFDMSTYLTVRGVLKHEGCDIPDTLCGSAVCLAGAAAFLSKDRSFSSISNVAKRYLGLDIRQAHYMFRGCWSINGLNATKEEAVQYLDDCIAKRTIYPNGEGFSDATS